MLRPRIPFARRFLGSRSLAPSPGLVLALILVIAAALRFSWPAWDGGLWLQPDERQIYFVANGLGLPESLTQAFRIESPLNPRFFAYGSVPIYLVRLVALLVAPLWPALRDPGNLHLAGRPLAALLDVGSVFLTYRLAMSLEAGHTVPRAHGEVARRLRAKTSTGLLAAALVSLAVLPIQSSHFYTADVPLTFLVLLSLSVASDLVRQGGRGRRAALGVAVGLALATKLSAAPLLFTIPAACWLSCPLTSADSRRGWLRASALVLGIAAAAFLLAEPYAVVDLRTFLTQTLRESQIAWGRLDVPYTRQFAGTLPYLYPIWQTALWALGLPMGVLGWAGLSAGLIRWLRDGDSADALLLAWAGPYFAITGALYARPLRYMLPLLPVLCILQAQLLAHACRRAPATVRRWLVAGSGLVLLASLAYALAFVSVYMSPHPCIVASDWIYEHIPSGSSLAVEEWDTPLPLPIEVDGHARRSEEFHVRTLALYDQPDGTGKWLEIARDLADSDYLLIASRRLYGSIPRLPADYPVASRYYPLLFKGDLGFELVAEFTRGAPWLNPRFEPLPGAAPAFLAPDESLVVNDRPRVLLFRNTGLQSPEELLGRLGLSGE